MGVEKLKVVHYLNQFFGQVGGEEKAGTKFLVKKGTVGPGSVLQKLLGDSGEVVATVICGDNYFAENIEQATKEGVELVETYKPDMFFAGPAFGAGRYGICCGAMCKGVYERLDIPVITGMFEENPGVEMYRNYAWIVKTGDSARGMQEDMKKMVDLIFKVTSKGEASRVFSGENIGRPEEDGYFARLMIRDEWTEKNAAERGLDMLLAKLKGEPFQTEVNLPEWEAIEPPKPVKDMKSTRVALLSDGGLVPKGNPDKLKSIGNEVWHAYEIDSLFPKPPKDCEIDVMHTGYYPQPVLENRNRLVPVDVMRDLAKEGIIGELHPYFYSLSGNAGRQSHCERIGSEIAAKLMEAKVGAAILTST